MRGPSQDSLSRLADQLGGRADANMSGDLFAVADLLDTQPALRRALSEPFRPDDDKARLANALLGDQISAEAGSVVEDAVRARWSAPRDLADALEQLGVLTEIVGAQHRDELDELEDELFRFDRVVAGDAGLRQALSSRAVPAEHRAALVRQLLGDQATAATVRLVERAARTPRGRTFATSMRWYIDLAADWRDRLVATVRVAVPLSEREGERLTRALAAQYGHGVRLNVIVDPNVLGGVRVEVGDEVIDGSVASRLGWARQGMAG